MMMMMMSIPLPIPRRLLIRKKKAKNNSNINDDDLDDDEDDDDDDDDDDSNIHLHSSNRTRKLEFLHNLKLLLVYEAVHAFMYYKYLHDGRNILVKNSPRLYESSECKKYLPFLSFLP